MIYTITYEFGPYTFIRTVSATNPGKAVEKMKNLIMKDLKEEMDNGSYKLVPRGDDKDDTDE